MKHSWRLVLAVMVVVLAIAAAGCGSSKSGSSSSSSGGATTSANEATGTPIKLGVICACTDPGSAVAIKPWKTIIGAWESWVNDNGGINGHPVTVYTEDDQGDPAIALSGVKTLVQQDKVVALMSSSERIATFEKYAEEQGIPVFCGTVETSCYGSADLFPQVPTISAQIYGFLKHAEDQGLTKVGVAYCAESPQCASFGPLTQAILENVVGSGQMVWAGSIAVNQPDYTAPCLAAQQAGAQAVWPTQAFDVNAKFIENCRQQGYEPVVLNCCGALGPPTDNYGGSNAIYSGSTPPINNTQTPGGKLFWSVMNKYAPSLQVEDVSDYVLPMWAGLVLFKHIGDQQKLTPNSTYADVKQGLYALKSYTTGGITVPLTYIKGQPTDINCWFNKSVKDGTVVADGLGPECVPQDKVAALNAVFGG